MKKLFAVLVFTSCATVAPANPYAYEEAAECPGRNMTEGQFASGTVQCRAMCSSWGRDMERFNAADCKCLCRSSAPHVYSNQM